MRQFSVRMEIPIAIGTDNMPAVKEESWRGERFLKENIPLIFTGEDDQ